MTLEEYKQKVEDYILQSASKISARILMSRYENELQEFYQKKYEVSLAGTLIMMGY